MIEAHELTKRYGEKTAVDGISFTIAPGSVTGFLGPSGAGNAVEYRSLPRHQHPRYCRYRRHRRLEGDQPMSTTGAAPDTDREPAFRAAVPARATFAGTVRGEGIKLLSLRSTWWVLAATVSHRRVRIREHVGHGGLAGAWPTDVDDGGRVGVLLE